MRRASIVADDKFCSGENRNELGYICFARKVDYVRLGRGFEIFGNGFVRFGADSDNTAPIFRINFFGQSGKILYRPFFDSTVAPGTNTA